MRISKNISYNEAIKSQTAVRHGLDNTPNKEQLKAMKLVANKIFQPVREEYGVPIFVSSFFRAPKVNVKAGGSATSSHPKGEAIDMDADVYGEVTNSEIFHYIKDNLEFDQLIWEYGDGENPAWVHASYSADGNRNQILIIYKENGKTKTSLYSEEELKRIYG